MQRVARCHLSAVRAMPDRRRAARVRRGRAWRLRSSSGGPRAAQRARRRAHRCRRAGGGGRGEPARWEGGRACDARRAVRGAWAGAGRGHDREAPCGRGGGPTPEVSSCTVYACSFAHSHRHSRRLSLQRNRVALTLYLLGTQPMTALHHSTAAPTAPLTAALTPDAACLGSVAQVSSSESRIVVSALAPSEEMSNGIRAMGLEAASDVPPTPLPYRNETRASKLFVFRRQNSRALHSLDVARISLLLDADSPAHYAQVAYLSPSGLSLSSVSRVRFPSRRPPTPRAGGEGVEQLPFSIMNNAIP